MAGKQKEKQEENVRITQSTPRSRGSIISGLILIFVGTFFLLRNFFKWLDFGYAWPVMLIIIGLVILIKRD